jgi:hypothetical protein
LEGNTCLLLAGNDWSRFFYFACYITCKIGIIWCATGSSVAHIKAGTGLC